MSSGHLTAEDTVKHWVDQLKELFEDISAKAKSAQWTDILSSKEVKEDPFGLGASVKYDAPVLTLKRLRGAQEVEQRVIFEPMHRFTVGSAGRVDVYSRPTLREAMLLRTPDVPNADTITWEEAETRVANAPWKVFSGDRIPLKNDLATEESVQQLLEDLTS